MQSPRSARFFVAITACLTFAGVLWVLVPGDLWRLPPMICASASVAMLFFLIAAPHLSNPDGQGTDAPTIASIGLTFGLFGTSFLLSLAALILTLSNRDRLGEAALIVGVGLAVASYQMIRVALGVIASKSRNSAGLGYRN